MKQILICAGLFALSNVCLGQSFIKTYAAQPDTAVLAFSSVAPAPDGGWVAGGFIRSAITYGSFLARFSPEGTLLWSRRADGIRDPQRVVVLPDGSTLLFNNNSSFQGYFDASVLRVSANGDWVSETIWGAPDDQDDWYGAAQWPSGEVVAVGISRLSSSISQRILLAKWSASGQLLWEKTFDADQFSSLTEFLLLPNGGFYALGGAFAAGSSQSMLGKFDPNGNLEWLKGYDYNPDGSFFSQGVQLSDGNLLMASYKNGLGINTAQMLLLRLDPQGNVLSQQSLTSVSDLSALEMSLPHPDTVLIAGVSNGQIFPVVDNDPVLIRVRPDGTLIGSLALGTEGQDFPYDAFLRNGQAVLAGTFDTTSFGTGQRASIIRTQFYSSCCEKDVTVVQGPIPALPVVTDLSFLPSPVPTRQNITGTMVDFPLQETTTCQSYTGSNLLGTDTTICTGDTLSLDVQAGLFGALLWNNGATTPTIEVTQPGIYVVTLTGECGTASDNLVITSVGNRVDAQVSADTALCPGASTVLEASGGSAYLWSPPLGLSTVQSASPQATPPTTTTYSVLVSSGQCRDSASTTITVRSAPTIVATPPVVQIPFGGDAQISVSGADSYVWTPTSGLSCFLCDNPVASPDDTLTYTVLGTDANGCIGTGTVTVNVQAPCPFYVPNVFHPDGGDGNGQFGVFGGNPTVFLLRVYNRWGELVFESPQPTALWDGSFRSKPAPAGVYIYDLEMSTCNGIQRVRGDVTLVR